MHLFRMPVRIPGCGSADRIGSDRRNPPQSNICLLKVAGKEDKSKHPFEKILDTEQTFVM